MYGPRAQRSFVDKIRPMNPTISTVEWLNISALFLCTRWKGNKIHVHMPPTTSGTKYHVFLLTTWNEWNAVVIANATTNTIAAVRDGWYRYGTHALGSSREGRTISAIIKMNCEEQVETVRWT
jgi:hypothetical protein